MSGVNLNNDWGCPHCHTINSANVVYCSECNYRRWKMRNGHIKNRETRQVVEPELKKRGIKL